MTPEQRAALVEKVARVLRGFYSDEPIAACDGVAFKAANAAIDLIRAETLEEAARVAGPSPDDVGGIEYTTGRKYAAAAIRALKGKA